LKAVFQKRFISRGSGEPEDGKLPPVESMAAMLACANISVKWG
jgi:hypothetical protein